jgi:uncharacterized SAM-binding protein YcdF (DUF218 family)
MPVHETDRTPPRRAGVLTAVGFAAGGFILLLALWSVWALPERLVVDDPLESADFIYVLNGKITVRSRHAAFVYGEGTAPLVLIPLDTDGEKASGVPGWPSMTALIVRGMEEHGVPRQAIHLVPFPDGVTNTRDEARALRHYLETRPAQRIVVVTTDYHTARARLVLRQELGHLRRPPEIRMSAAPDPAVGAPRDWWRTAAGRRSYLSELVKLLVVRLQ